MARVLRLYANFTPNQSNNTFYMYANTANYLTKILGHLKQIEIPLGNYRINTGVIKIKKDIENILNNLDLRFTPEEQLYFEMTKNE